MMTAECFFAAGAVLAEGPVWHGRRLLWVDIERGEIHELDPRSGADRSWSFPHRVGFVVPSTAGDWVVGTERGFARFDPHTGALSWGTNPEAGIPGNRFNDAKCDTAGRLWAGTMARDEAPGRGSLYRVDADGRVKTMVPSVSISNGLAWSPDGRTLYYVDSPTRRVDAFDFEPTTGEISHRRTVIEVTDGYPDGMCVDASGCLWIALWGGGCVACHDPRSGARRSEVRLPVEAVTSCCFGESEELWITTASRDLDAAGRKRQPLAGGIFRARVGIKGFATSLFAGRPPFP